MIVEPDFLDHWKTRLLVQRLSDEAAPLMVIRLWAHCQSRKRWQFEGMTDEILAAICRSNVEGDVLKTHLRDCGFIEIENGSVTVHDWEVSNRLLVSAWSNGTKGGRPTQSGKPIKTDRKPTGCQSANRRQTSPSNLSYKSTSTVQSLGKSENPFLLERVRKLFGKRSGTPMDASEVRAWGVAIKSVESTSDEDWALIEWVYQQSGGSACQYRRKDMATLLNNWNCEIDRARGWKSGNSNKVNEKPDPRRERLNEERHAMEEKLRNKGEIK